MTVPPTSTRALCTDTSRPSKETLHCKTYFLLLTTTQVDIVSDTDDSDGVHYFTVDWVHQFCARRAPWWTIVRSMPSVMLLWMIQQHEHRCVSGISSDSVIEAPSQQFYIFLCVCVCVCVAFWYCLSQYAGTNHSYPIWQLSQICKGLREWTVYILRFPVTSHLYR